MRRLGLLFELQHLIFMRAKMPQIVLKLISIYINLIYHNKVMNNSQVLNGTFQTDTNPEGKILVASQVKGRIKGSKRQKSSKKDIFDEKGEQWSSNKRSSSYYWTPTQNSRYIKFLQEYGSLLLLSPPQRKKKKVNLIMSRKIKTRNSTQCHTHHQKMIQKYKSIEGIIQNYIQQKNDKSNITQTLETQKPLNNIKVEVIVEEAENEIEMKTASQILAIGSIVVLKDYTHIEELEYEYSQFHQIPYNDPFNEIDLF